jgi:hypothetical protein
MKISQEIWQIADEGQKSEEFVVQAARSAFRKSATPERPG